VKSNDAALATDTARLVTASVARSAPTSEPWPHFKQAPFVEAMALLRIGNEALWVPERLVEFEHWVGHIPFAFWLTSALRPRTFVELGTHRGNSYCAFCQAISRLGINCSAYAVDTWKGDLHMGFQEGLLDELRSHHDHRYGDFSSLLEMTFDEAASRFEPGSIDLLHIDGTHTYDSVSHDFNLWHPLLSDRAIVLFHDINVYKEDYGVWRLWSELKCKHPSYEFTHSYGLGVLAVGPNVPHPLVSLFDTSHHPELPSAVRLLFSHLGDALVSRLRSQTLEKHTQSLTFARTKLEAELVEARKANERSNALLAERATQMDHFQRECAEQIQQLRSETMSRIESFRNGITQGSNEHNAHRMKDLQLELDLQRSRAEAAIQEAEDSKRVITGTKESLSEANSKLEEAHRKLLEMYRTWSTAAKDVEQLKIQIRATEARANNFEQEVSKCVQESAAAIARAAASDTQASEALRALRQIQDSTIWKASFPLRRALTTTSPRTRQLVRRLMKLAWWTATFKLPSKIASHRTYDVLPMATPKLESSTSTPEIPAPIFPSSSPKAASLPDFFECKTMPRSGRIAVVLHLHYEELWPEIHQVLASIEEPFDLFVSVQHNASRSIEREIRSAFASARVLRFENRGRDLLPFIALINSGVLFNYELVCKVHSKRSPHRNDGDRWRTTLLSGVLGNKALVEDIVQGFETDADLGIVVAQGQIYGAREEHWVDNRDRVVELGGRIGIERVPTGSTFPGGSIYWIRPFLLRTIAALKLTANDFEPEPIAVDGTTGHAVERLIGLVCRDAGMRIEEATSLIKSPLLPVALSTPKPPTVRQHVIAYYLPQFHPTQENDKWWGTGFTEWANVTRATSLYRHHRQPRLPADLGFYDLRVPEVRERQADLARKYGVSAFCYYYYWFDGQRMLHRPIDEVLSSGKPDFPFLICWANEPWSRNWDGGNRELLMPQNYEPGWVEKFASDIAPLLRDARYFRFDNRPVLMIYRVMHIPNRTSAFATLRESLKKHGVDDIYLCGGWVGFEGDEVCPDTPQDIGLDAYIEFPPHRLSAAQINDALRDTVADFSGRAYSYDSAIETAVNSLPINADSIHRCVMMGWDNTPRRLARSHSFHNATPAKFRRWIRSVVRHEQTRLYGKDSMIFVNAWNEWAEGTYLEPDRDFGHGWLEAVASALGETPRN
jgi:lipopolysaccharide biosynthesis protein